MKKVIFRRDRYASGATTRILCTLFGVDEDEQKKKTTVFTTWKQLKQVFVPRWLAETVHGAAVGKVVRLDFLYVGDSQVAGPRGDELSRREPPVLTVEDFALGAQTGKTGREVKLASEWTAATSVWVWQILAARRNKRVLGIAKVDEIRIREQGPIPQVLEDAPRC